jgi:hypothetical protein
VLAAALIALRVQRRQSREHCQEGSAAEKGLPESSSAGSNPSGGKHVSPSSLSYQAALADLQPSPSSWTSQQGRSGEGPAHATDHVASLSPSSETDGKHQSAPSSMLRDNQGHRVQLGTMLSSGSSAWVCQGVCTTHGQVAVKVWVEGAGAAGAGKRAWWRHTQQEQLLLTQHLSHPNLIRCHWAHLPPLPQPELPGPACLTQEIEEGQAGETEIKPQQAATSPASEARAVDEHSGSQQVPCPQQALPVAQGHAGALLPRAALGLGQAGVRPTALCSPLRRLQPRRTSSMPQLLPTSPSRRAACKDPLQQEPHRQLQLLPCLKQQVPCLVMEMAEQSLAQALHSGQRKLPRQTALQHVYEVACALAYLHSRGVAHGGGWQLSLQLVAARDLCWSNSVTPAGDCSYLTLHNSGLCTP